MPSNQTHCVNPGSVVSGAAGLQFSADERQYAYAVARRIVRDDQDAHDVAQEAMMLAYRHRGSFRGDARPRTWLHRIVVTTALSYLRSAARRARQLGLMSAEPTATTATPEQLLTRREQASELTAQVAQLGDKYRDVLALRLEELSDLEIAQRLDITVSSVKVRSHRARHQLRQRLSGAPQQSAA